MKTHALLVAILLLGCSKDNGPDIASEEDPRGNRVVSDVEETDFCSRNRAWVDTVLKSSPSVAACLYSTYASGIAYHDQKRAKQLLRNAITALGSIKDVVTLFVLSKSVSEACIEMKDGKCIERLYSLLPECVELRKKYIKDIESNVETIVAIRSRSSLGKSKSLKKFLDKDLLPKLSALHDEFIRSRSISTVESEREICVMTNKSIDEAIISRTDETLASFDEEEALLRQYADGNQQKAIDTAKLKQHYRVQCSVIGKLVLTCKIPIWKEKITE